MACVCTIVEGSDESCLLKHGDHDFIKHDSYVAYGFCRIENAKALTKGVEKKIFVDKGQISEAIYRKIITGLRKSPFTKPFVLDFLKEIEKKETKK